MTFDEALHMFSGNWVLWIILALGFGCYLLLFHFLFSPRDKQWTQRVGAWLRALTVLLSALPLLGLLGTIEGIMSTFNQLSRGQGLDHQTLLSSGISDALITTQLGLVLVIPGLVLLARLRSQYQQAVNSNA